MILDYRQFAKCNESYRSGGVVFVSEQYKASMSQVETTLADEIKMAVDIGHSLFYRRSFVVPYRCVQASYLSH